MILSMLRANLPAGWDVRRSQTGGGHYYVALGGCAKPQLERPRVPPPALSPSELELELHQRARDDEAARARRSTVPLLSGDVITLGDAVVPRIEVREARKSLPCEAAHALLQTALNRNSSDNITVAIMMLHDREDGALTAHDTCTA